MWWTHAGLNKVLSTRNLLHLRHLVPVPQSYQRCEIGIVAKSHSEPWLRCEDTFRFVRIGICRHVDDGACLPCQLCARIPW